jgi:hypothetical protein
VWEIPAWLVDFAEEIGSQAGEVSVDGRPMLSPLDWIYPPEDLSLGDFTTDIAFSLASQQGRSPQVISEELLCALPSHLSKCCRCERGFINGTIPRESLSLVKQVPPFGQRTLAIAFPGWDSEGEFMQYCAVVAAAVLQTQCSASLGVPVDLYVGSELFLHSEECGGEFLGEMFRKALQKGVEGRGERSLSGSRGTVCSQDVLVYQWGSVGMRYDHVFRHEADGGAVSNQILYPDANGRVNFEDRVIPDDLLRWSAEELSSFVLCIIRAMADHSLDVSACQLGERLNLLWFVDTLQKRISRYRRQFVSGGWEAGREVDSEFRELMMRSVLFPLSLYRAVRRGGVVPFVTGVSQMADRGNAFFNSPSLRNRLDRPGSMTGGDQKILSGLMRGLVQFQEVVAPYA